MNKTPCPRLSLLLFAGWLGALASLPAQTTGHGGTGHGPVGVIDANGCTNVLITNLTAFSQPLPIPANAVPARFVTNYCVPVATNLCFTNPIPVYDMPMVVITNFQFHPSLPGVDVWGYAGQYPGPTIQAEVNQPVLVNWINNLPTNYPNWLQANTTVHPNDHYGQLVRTVVHLHGAAVLPRYDGYPTNWFTTGNSDQYFYQNLDLNDDGETLWYHDHAIGVTANNVYAGLAGFYILKNTPWENAYATNGHPLPSGKYEIPLVIQDKDFQTNCAPATLVNAGVPPWHYHAVVNGKVTPYLNVEPTKYRFKVLNGAGFRTWGLNLKVTDTNGVSATNAPAAPQFTVLGTEDGFMQSPVNVNAVMMMNGERVDLVIDFSNYANTNITMYNQVNNAEVPSTNGPFITNIMQFRVSATTTNPASTLPPVLVPDWVPTTNMVLQAVTNRQLTLDLNYSPYYPGPPFNSDPNAPGYFALINMEPFEAPIDDFMIAGDTETWSIINLSSEAHPLHVHLLDFRVVSRTHFGTGTTNTWNGNITNPPAMVLQYVKDRTNHTLKPLSYYLDTNATATKAARPFENGPKDVVHAAPFSMTTIVMKWPTNSLFYTTPSAVDGDPATDGRYIFHCHILDHEDNDMMRPMQLLSPKVLPLQAIRDAKVNPSASNRFRLLVRTLSGVKYALETATTLTNPVWTPVSGNEIVGDGEPLQVVPPPATEQTRFYRVRPVP
jgi:spore coat protein A